MSDNYFLQQPAPENIEARKAELGAWFEIDLNDIAFNLKAIRDRVGPHVEIMPVVKNDAYGHGLRPIVAALAADGVNWFMVARTAEALAIRESGITSGIVNMDALYTDGQYQRIVEQDISQVIYTPAAAEKLTVAARAIGRKAGVFIKIDTGLRRVGVPAAEAVSFIETIAASAHLEIRGIFSTFMLHPERDAGVLARFRAITDELAEKGIDPGYCSLASSHGIFHSPEAWLGMVRPALSLFGIYNGDEDRTAGLALRQALCFKARIEHLKWIEAGDSVTYFGRFTATERMRVGTLHVGFYDAVPREHSNTGQILVDNVLRPCIGSVSLNHYLFDATGLNVREGDVVEVYSRAAGNNIADASETAGWMTYSLLNHLNPFVPRIYYRGKTPVAILERSV
ncbi:MAG: alanine racemase [Rhodospirillaceae bacterium]|nr:alanine racemase [Rhodospirillaceae bacterium]MBT5191288.1 alanine racemase [Rhodospirillaceae bacterium]MBT5896624.1 alanine racemase [Rhodospirillaceae bacterium]MBT6428704.1 alanine racemase [Rhodospirillaceae bacterium]MBT7666905.1 alanine racemase [Rhodospirillaceae bacterium]